MEKILEKLMDREKKDKEKEEKEKEEKDWEEKEICGWMQILDCQ